MSLPITYGTYLGLDKILGAQEPPGPDGRPRPIAHHDEMLFLIVHQAYELWFKQVLHELKLSRDLLAQDPVPEPDIMRVVMALHRVHEIQKIFVAQLGVLETMQPADFLAFRDALGNASGFQSVQFRELELLAGLKDDARYEYEGRSFERRFAPGEVERFAEIRRAPTLRDALARWLARTPLEPGFEASYLKAFDAYVKAQRDLQIGNPQLAAAERDATLKRLDAYLAQGRAFLGGPEAKTRAACLFIAAYREEPLLHWPNRLLDSLLEFEELWRLWRFRHARMVERMIGLRVGTGGSSGVDYLDKTAGSRYRIFTFILESRSFLVPRRLLPDLSDKGRYGYALERGS
ncbi:MAG TPA: tryptophan 2,3-dioxygenase family protein [Planctomycetota bacterium]|nr:tryptophan 2,3-dioxygenase family protein [Planctomycetota bacterium]